MGHRVERGKEKQIPVDFVCVLQVELGRQGSTPRASNGKMETASC